MCSPELGTTSSSRAAKIDTQKSGHRRLGPLSVVQAQKETYKSVFTGGWDHFQQVRVRKETHKNLLAGSWHHFWGPTGENLTVVRVAWIG